jgi:hypothetical protein
MNVYNNLNIKSLAIFNLLVLNNYFLHLVGVNIFFLKFNLILIFCCFIFCFFINFKSENILILSLIICYLIIILGSPTQDHDARSVWLFHGKRIYYDQNIYSQLDGYAEFFSNNDYNPFSASLSATLAHLINNWNEVFPKFSNLIIATPAILFLNFFLKNKKAKIFLFLALLFIFEKKVVNGEMDAILSLYIISVILSYFLLVLEDNKKREFFFLFLLTTTFTSILILVKPEAIISLLFILLIFFFFKYCKIIKEKIKIFFLVIIIPFLFFFHWKFKVFNSSVKNLYLNSIDFEILKYKLFNIKIYFEIIEGLVLNKTMFISLIFYFILLKKIINYSYKKDSYYLTVTSKIDLKNKIFLFVTIYCLFYFIFLFIIFLVGFGQQETKLSLEQGAFRYTQPIAFSLCYIFCLFLDKEKDIN